VAGRLERGQIWMLERPRPDHRRPVLILSRPALIRVLRTVTVAAVTSTIRGAPTEVTLGFEEGLKHESCVNLVNLFTVPQSQLGQYVGNVTAQKMRAVCNALIIACGCD
jgi:mRNA interferase MazF